MTRLALRLTALGMAASALGCSNGTSSAAPADSGGAPSGFVCSPPSSTAASAAGSDASAAEVQAFVGSWVRSGSTTTTCPGSAPTTATFAGTVVMAPGSNGGTIAQLNPSGCVTVYSVDGSAATAPAGQICDEIVDGEIKVETLATHALTLNADGTTVSSTSTASLSDPAATMTCTTSSSATYTKVSAGMAAPAALPSVCTEPACCLSRFATGGYQLPYYRTFALDQPDPRVTQVVVFLQGFDHDAAGAFSTLVTAAAMEGQLATTLIVAPHFAVVDTKGTCDGHDDTEPGDLTWSCDAWTNGLAASNAPAVTSYGALDALIGAIEGTFPQLQRIIVSGFSAGGQFTDRYAAATTVDQGGQGIPFRYVIGDPSSYQYFDERRPLSSGDCTTLDCPQSFAPYADAGQCPSFDETHYGTASLEGAAASFTPAQLERAFLSRTIRYLLGTLDDAPTTAADYAQLDTSCAAEAQGPFRLQRGLSFYSYVTTLLGAGQQQAQLAPGCGHSAPCVFQSAPGLSAVFGE